jgi:hypothetical protein
LLDFAFCRFYPKQHLFSLPNNPVEQIVSKKIERRRMRRRRSFSRQSIGGVDRCRIKRPTGRRFARRV